MSGGKAPPRLDGETALPEFPEPIGHVWSWFIEIMTGVKSDGMGPRMIAWSDLSDWCEITGERLEPWEAKLLVDLGSLRASIESEKMKSDGHQQQI